MKRVRKSLLVGVTGGIGSGKSTVCRILERLGRTVISADEIANVLTDHDEKIRSDLRTTFGPDIYTIDGRLDRKRLAAIVFADKALKKKLDQIVHPGVFTAIDGRIAALSPEKCLPYVAIEAALIYESGMDKQLDYTIVVDAKVESRISRVINRDGASREDVLNRIKSQMDPMKKLSKADFVIVNDGAEEDLAGQVEFIDGLLTMIGKSRV